MTAGDRVGPEQDHPATPFHDLAAFTALPRLSDLVVSPDGARLVTSVAVPSADGKQYVTALWEIDPRGDQEARRLTRSAPGEAKPRFLPDGRLLFTSKRPDTARRPEDQSEDVAQLWLLPAGAGEARQVVACPGGIAEVAVAQDAGDVAFLARVLPGATSIEEDDRRRKERKDAGVSAVLHERHPVRHWDHDLGPDQARLFAAGPVAAGDEALPEPRDLTPDPGGRIEEGLAVSPDGRWAALVWRADDVGADHRIAVAVLDLSTGDRRLLVEDQEAEFSAPVFSPDGRSLVCIRDGMGSWEEAPGRTFWHVDLETGTGRDLLPNSQIWPSGAAVFAPDGGSIFFAGDLGGRAPVFRLDLSDDSVTRLTASGAHADVVVAPDGTAVYALRSAVDEPPTPVRIDPDQADQQPTRLRSPAPGQPLPGTVTELTIQADDGVPLRAWLALPAGASAVSPAPLLLWIHGGPLSSSNAWSWRWNPWLLVARGYSVLLPDPGLSTGYGDDFVNRGWGAWGQQPYTDLMAFTDAACARDDVDETRTGAMGGSFGGYMANWVATQTDRFRAIVTHASLWHLEQFAGTTDVPSYWQREFGDPLRQTERYQANSPHLHVAEIRTPMLVIHGDKDYRVPIGEALRLWYDLCRFSVPAKFLYFPDENHWVLTPGHARVWYETVTAFLAQHVLGKDWEQPTLL
jgi:dipeptidyl aminopeptidase/acylaminoacyl peptidase